MPDGLGSEMRSVETWRKQMSKKKIVLWSIGGVVAVAVAVGIANGGTAPSTSVGAAPADQFTTTTSQPIPALTATEVAAPPAKVAQYSPQVEAARDSAQRYIALKGFSRDGLIKQLSSDYADAYPKTIATEAVDSLGLDYDVQAARAARSYLELKSFSCAGLTSQLASSYADSFTKAQASVGAHQAGVC
jgi:hypothetical protein